MDSVLVVTDGDLRIQPALTDFAHASAERGVRVAVVSAGRRLRRAAANRRRILSAPTFAHNRRRHRAL
jgi:hypothetical protein